MVEGHGEVEALPVLIRRIAQEFDPQLSVIIPQPIRSKRDRLLHRSGELERAIELAARNVAGAGGILLILDADQDCPAELGPRLLKSARAARSDMIDQTPLTAVMSFEEARRADSFDKCYREIRSLLTVLTIEAGAANS